MHHRRGTVTVLAAGLLLTSIAQPLLFSTQNDGSSDALDATLETAVSSGDRDILLINGNAFDLS